VSESLEFDREEAFCMNGSSGSPRRPPQKKKKGSRPRIEKKSKRDFELKDRFFRIELVFLSSLCRLIIVNSSRRRRMK